MVLEVAEHGSGLQVDTATKKTPYKSLSDLSPQEQRDRLRQLGSESLYTLLNHQPEKGALLPATLDRYDDESFNHGTSWTRDIEEAIAPAVDPNFRRAFPEQIKDAERFFLVNQRLLLQRYAWENEWWRFDQRPQPIEGGLVMVHDDLAPTTKFDHNKHRVHPWSHNQLDATARILSLSAAAIKLGIPLLDQTPDDIRPTGEILLKMASYHAPQTVSNLGTHGPWGNDHCLAPGSSKAQNTAGLLGIYRIYPELEKDAKQKGYPLYISRKELSQAITAGSANQFKEFPYDWTAPYGHPDRADLAQLKLIADVGLAFFPYIKTILEQTRSLEHPLGFMRFSGDKWKKDETNALYAWSAPWTLGLLYMAHADAKMATVYFNFGLISSAQTCLEHGLLMMDRSARMIHDYGYLPELHFQDPNDGFKYKPNNNRLSWGEAMTSRACSALDIALEISEQFHQ